MDRDRLLRVLTQLPQVLRDDYDLDELMGSFGDDVAAILGVDGAGVMLEDDQGDLRFVAASEPVLQELERLQIELGEGPCLHAYRTGEEVVADLAEEPRFSHFAAAASHAGMRMVFSLPLVSKGGRIGALNFYSSGPYELSEEAMGIARTLASVATAYLSHARDLAAYRIENVQLSHALDSRIVVEQAKGFVAARRGVDATKAWELIRDRSRSDQRRAHDVAAALLSGELDADAL